MADTSHLRGHSRVRKIVQPGLLSENEGLWTGTNYVFYTLATGTFTQYESPWNTQYAFQLFAEANQSCWLESGTFIEAADCVSQTIPSLVESFQQKGIHKNNGAPWSKAELQNHLRKAFAQIGLYQSLNQETETAFSFSKALSKISFSNLTQSYGKAVTAGDTQWQWLWDFGHDAQTSTEFSPIHTFPASGDYVVTLTATSPTGNTDDFRFRVSVIDDYCTVTMLSPIEEFYTAALKLGDQVNASGASGYADYTQSPLLIAAGTDPAFTVLIGDYPNSDFSRKISMWLDTNNDGVFDVATDKLFEQSATGSLSGQLGFIGEVNKSYRLRLVTGFSYLDKAP